MIVQKKPVAFFTETLNCSSEIHQSLYFRELKGHVSTYVQYCHRLSKKNQELSWTSGYL